jgi:hypothetical protein
MDTLFVEVPPKQDLKDPACLASRTPRDELNLGLVLAGAHGGITA